MERLPEPLLRNCSRALASLGDEIGFVVDEPQRASVTRAARLAAVVSRNAVSEICRLPA